MRLWREHGALLVAELSKLEPPLWRLGGGTMLAKAWRHRLSFDLDITIPTGGSRYKEQAALDRIETELRRRNLDVTNDAAGRLLRARTGVVDDHGNDGGIDIWVHDPGLPGSAPPEQVAGTLVDRLSTAQIIHGKLHRDRSTLVRDAYDITHAHRMDPEALETAVNSLSPKHSRRAEVIYASQSPRMDTEESAILDWNGRPARDQRGCGRRAGQIIHDSRWIEIEVAIENGRVLAATTTTAGIRRERLGPAGASPGEAVERLAETGILDNLRHHCKGTEWTVVDVIDRITGQSGTNERTVRIAPQGSLQTSPGSAVFRAESAPEPPRVGGPRDKTALISSFDDQEPTQTKPEKMETRTGTKTANQENGDAVEKKTSDETAGADFLATTGAGLIGTRKEGDYWDFHSRGRRRCVNGRTKSRNHRKITG